MRSVRPPVSARCTPVIRRRSLALQASHLRGTASALAEDSQLFSPAHGALLFGAPALSNTWAGTSDSASTQLARSLFHRHDSNEPLQPCKNRSLPAAHLDASLQGHVLGLAARGASPTEVRAGLLSLGIAPLARSTKVSIARFERLVALVAGGGKGGAGAGASWSAESRATGGHGHGTPSGVALMLAFVWASARSKADLLRFLEALHMHQPPGATPLFAVDADPHCDSWRDAWLEQQMGSDINYLLGGGSVSVAPTEEELAAMCRAELSPDALERLAYTLLARDGCAPEVRQEHHGYLGQPPIADCVEACARAALGLALWQPAAGAYDPALLPPTADAHVAAFFGAGGEALRPTAGASWFVLLSARPSPPGLRYMIGDGQLAYELYPSVPNFVALLESLLHLPITPPRADVAAPVWQGSEMHWTLEGCSRHPVIHFVRRRQQHDRHRPRAGTARAAASASADVPPTVTPTEELRVVFNGERHCYTLHNALATEPAWVSRVRHAWRAIGGVAALPPTARAAAARLLATDGQDVRARE